MSTTIDQRVVEMRFDNRHFETNVATTMSTLDKLKHKLHLDGASKGLENVNNAAKNVKMDGLGSAVETVSAKFSALQVMGVTALANIANSAVNAGKRIVESLTIAPVKDGWGEYEMTLNAVQTTMAGTGKTAKEVETELKKLDEYADKTVYSTADMLNNLPKFTNAGVELEKATQAMIGIANATALAGGDAGKASIAFYNLGQAIGTGYLTRMDYNSINNAGIATMEWKNQMVEAALAAGTLEKAEDGLYIAGNKTLTLQQLFIDGLQEQWATTDVMMKVFGDYGDETTEIGEKAYNAAQDIKTFSMMMDSLKATAGTGWKDTWQTIFGGLDEAKVFWTGLSEFISGIITKMADIRNGILEGALGKGFSSLGEKINGLLEPAAKAAETVKDTVETITDLGAIVDEVILGKFGNGTDRYDALTEAGHNYYEVQNKVNEKLGDSFRHTQEQIDAQNKLLGVQGKTADSTEKTAEAQEKLTEEQAKQIAKLAELSDAELKALGYTEEQIAAFKELRKTADKLGVPLDELITKIDEIDGRWLLIDSFKNIGKGLIEVFNAMKTAWEDIFPPKSIEQRAEQLFNIVAAFHKLSASLVGVFYDGEKLTETGDKLVRSFKGVFAIVDLITTIVGGGFRIAFKIVTELLSRFGLSVLDVTAAIGDAIVNFSTWFDETLGISKAVDVLVPIIESAAECISDLIKEFKETEFFKTVAGWFEDASEKISGAMDSISERIENFNASSVVKGLKSFGESISKFAKQVTNSELFTSVVDGIRTAFAKLKEFFGKFKLPEFNIDNLMTFFQGFAKIGEKIKGSGADGAMRTISGVGEHLKDNVIGWNWTVFKENALQKFVTFWLKTGDLIKKAFEVCKEVALSIKKFLFGTEEVNLPVIMDAVTKFLWIIALIKVIKLMDTIVSPFDNISNALNNFANSLKWDAISGAFKSLALALGVFTICILILTQMNLKDAWSAAGILMALMVVMGTIVTIMGLVASKVDGGLNAACATMSLLMLVGSIVLLMYALKEIDKLTLKDPSRTFLILAGILVALTAGVRMIAKAGGSSFRSVAAILTLMAALKLILEVIEDYDAFDWSGKSRAIKKMVEMLLALSVAIRIASGGTKAGASSKGLALTLIAMVVSLKILLGVIEEFAAMDDDTLLKGGLVVIALLGVMTLMSVALSRANKGSVLQKGEKSVNNFTGLALALLAVVAAIWLLGKMDIDTLKQGGLAVGQILLLFTVMLAAVGKSCAGLKMGSIITMMIAIGVLMAEMAIIIHTMKEIPWEQSLGSAGSLAGLLLSMAVVLRTIGKTNVKISTLLKWIGAMTALAGILAILAFVLYSIKGMNPTNSIGNAIALGGLLATMAGVLHILSALDMRKLSTKKMTKLGLIFVGMTAILASLGLVLAMMSALNVRDAIPNAIALSILIGVLTGVLAVLSLLKVNGGTFAAVGAIAVLGAVVLELGFFLHLMDGWNIGSMLSTVGVLSALLGVLTGVAAACTLLGLVANPVGIAIAIGAIALLGAVVLEIGFFLHLMEDWNIGSMMPMVKVLSTLLGVLMIAVAACTALGFVANPIGMAIAIGAIALLGAVVLEIGFFLHLMEGWNIGSMMPTVMVLSTLLGVLTGVAAACTLLGLVANPVGIAIAIGAIALLGAVVLEIGFFLHLMEDWNIGSMMPMVKVLSNMLIALTGVLVILTAIGFVSVAAVSGVNALTYMITLLGGLMVAIGGLMDLCPDIEKWLDSGLTLLKKLARGLGEMISEFGVGLTSGLPEMGENLSKFAESLDGFLTAMYSIDGSLVDNAANLVEAIATLTKADFLDGLNNLFKKADEPSSLELLGKELSGFATNAGTFVTAIGDMKPESATTLDTFCGAIETLNNACGNSNFGEGSLATFGEQVASFAESIKSVAESLSELTDTDVANIQRAAAAGEAIADLNTCIPKEGGLIQSIVGSADLQAWGVKISAFADSLVAYSRKVSGEKIDKDAIISSTEAATAISDLNASIPKAGGLWEALAGSQDIAAWGSKISAFADALVSYSSKVSGANIDKDAILRSADAASALAEVNNALPKTDGLWQTIAGEQDMAAFGTGLGQLADGLVYYANAATQIDDTKIDAIKKTGEAVDEINAVVEKLPNEGGVGSWFAGEINIESFGSGIKALATGISDYCAVAATITQDDIDAIQFSQNAVSAITTIAGLIPAGDYFNSVGALATAAEKLKSLCSTINSISTAEYDYSGIETIKGVIGDVEGLLSGIAVDDLAVEFETLKTIATKVRSCATLIAGLNGMTYGGVDTLKGALTSLSTADVDGVISAFSGKVEDMRTAVSDLIEAMTSGLKNGSDDVSSAATSTADAAISAVEDKADEFTKVGKSYGTNLQKAIEGKSKDVATAGRIVGASAATGAQSSSAHMILAGQWLGAGLVLGINSKLTSAYNAGYALGQAAVQGEKDGQASNSPSKLAIQAGKWLGEGLVIGMDQMGNRVYSQGRTLGETATESLSSSISKISDLVSSDIDTQPTIRPILDLSDVKSGANALNGMLDMNSSVGVMANVGTISSMMNQRGQNGVNDDVVSAINRLSKKMDSIGNTSYQINGVTYDDGSNITDAVKTIVRAARIERRV